MFTLIFLLDSLLFGFASPSVQKLFGVIFFKGSLTLQGNILCLAFTETMNNTYREIRTDENRS